MSSNQKYLAIHRHGVGLHAYILRPSRIILRLSGSGHVKTKKQRYWQNGAWWTLKIEPDI